MHLRSDRHLLEPVLLAHAAVADCAIVERPTVAGSDELVAFVVPAAPFLPNELEIFVRAAAPGLPHPTLFVPISSLPLASDGTLDRARLGVLEVVDASLARRWEAHLQRFDGIDRAAAQIEWPAESALPLHLGDVLPEWRAGARPAPRKPLICTADSPAVSHARTPALVDGGPVHIMEGAPLVLADALGRAAQTLQGIVYIEADGSERFQTYEDVLMQAERILGGLRRQSLSPGDRVVLQLERHQDFIETFWACILGGFVPVPLAVPARYDAPAPSMQTLQAAWPLLKASAIVATRLARHEVVAAAERLRLDGAEVHAIENLRTERDTRHFSARPDDLALLMLTSGSTGIPKAVRLSHANLLSRTVASLQLNGFSDADVSLNWMPLDHVAGLIYFHIRDVYLGCRQIQIPTARILQDPLGWLDGLHKYRATITFAPNFAYGLVNDREKELTGRSWDLSHVRFILNGAEAIVARTARRFLHLLAPYGLPATAMRPAWGMSETSSGVVYGDRFSLASTSDEDPFVEIGRPIPSLSMRIVDTDDRVVDEGVVGRLQVRGATVTHGYFNSPDLTRESFAGDGWFNTGDLGLIRDGRLTITGREKDVVIINSVNYYCHAIESVVEELDGIERSFTAACAVREPGADTDRLAIFFHSTLSTPRALADLVARIRTEVRNQVGISPDFLIPVETSAVPKTSVGKIQRSELARRLLAGEFAAALKQIERITASANTIPDWFHRKVWRRKDGIARPLRAQGDADALIFADREGVAAEVAAMLERCGVRAVAVDASDAFGRTGAGRYFVNPASQADYARLLTALMDDGVFPSHIIHLWDYGAYAGEATSGAIEQAQVTGALSALWLTQALARLPGDPRETQLTFVGSHTARVRPGEPIAYEKTPVVALIKSIPQEMPWLQCRHVDLYQAADAAAAARLIVEELSNGQTDREVAYRDGQRFVARLERVGFRAEARQDLPLVRGGAYLVTGGTGGIGERLSKYLLERYDARLLLVGRRPHGAVADVLRTLQQAGGSVTYESADVCDEQRLIDVVARAEEQWRQRLDGIIHLAGVYDESPLNDETADRLRGVFRPKTVGTEIVHRLLVARGGGLLISSSSLVGFFGGSGIGAYAAASSFQHAFAEHHFQRNGVAHYCFNWSNWEAVGHSRDYQRKDLPRSHGYQSMSGDHALQSLLIGLAFRELGLFVGLDGSHRHVRRFAADDAETLEKVVIYYTSRDGSAVEPGVDAIEVRDRFGNRTRPKLVQIENMPLTANGGIDRDVLALVARGGSAEAGAARPKTEMERQLAEIWKRLLAVPDVNVDDNFFQLGGDSLLAMRLLDQIRHQFGAELVVRAIFDATTLAELAAVVSRSVPATASASSAVAG